MNKEKFDAFVKDRYNKEVAWYDRKAIWNHRAYRICMWSVIFLAAITPILIVISDGIFKWVAVGVAVLVAVLNGALRAFKYHENWIGYRTTCETLRKEIHFYEASIQGYDAVADKEALFVERVESLISREHTLWVTTHEKEEPPKRK